MTIQEFLSKIPSENIRFMIGNSALMSIAMSSKRKPANIQMGIPDEIASELLRMDDNTPVLMLLAVERESFDRAKAGVET